MRTALFTLALLPTLCTAQSLTVAYDFGLKEPATVATTPVGRLNNVLGRGFSLDVDAFAGATFKTKTPLAGFMVGRRFALATEVTALVAVGAAVAQSQPVSLVVGAGVSWRF